MPIMRIVKEYNNRSPLSGIIEADTVSFKSRADGYAFVDRVQRQSKEGSLDWDLIDYEWALITEGVNEVLVNNTGGRIGVIRS